MSETVALPVPTRIEKGQAQDETSTNPTSEAGIEDSEAGLAPGGPRGTILERGADLLAIKPAPQCGIHVHVGRVQELK